jgi:hypothetical protein
MYLFLYLINKLIEKRYELKKKYYQIFSLMNIIGFSVLFPDVEPECSDT